MFAARYFAPRYFAPRYFAETGASTSDLNAIDAALSYFATSGLPALLSDGNLWESYAPRGTVAPFATIIEVSDVPSWTSGPGYWQETQVQLTVTATTKQDAKSIGASFADAFDDAPLSIGGRAVRACYRTAMRLDLADPTNRMPGGQEMHQQTLDYTIVWARARVR